VARALDGFYGHRIKAANAAERWGGTAQHSNQHAVADLLPLGSAREQEMSKSSITIDQGVVDALAPTHPGDALKD
jgi:hypothetical protein